jgi:hypothetical protein
MRSYLRIAFLTVLHGWILLRPGWRLDVWYKIFQVAFSD